MKGSLSWDFVIALIVIMLFASVVISFAYFQEEQIVVSGYKLESEILAISVGSLVNRLIAGNPDSLEANLTVHDPTEKYPFLSILVDSAECYYSFANNRFFVNITYTLKATGRKGEVSASYPVFRDLELKPRECGSSFKLSKSKGGWSVE